MTDQGRGTDEEYSSDAGLADVVDPVRVGDPVVVSSPDMLSVAGGGGGGQSATASGDDSVAVHTLHGNVNFRPVVLAEGVVRPPDDVAMPVGGVHNLPRRPTPVFLGREDLLVRLAALFTPDPQVPAPASSGARGALGQAITGLGGVGKSELALHYAATRVGPGALVWWAVAETLETLTGGLAALTYRLHPVATAAGWTTDQAAGWATGWLQAHTGWLLVLDNVEDPRLVTGLLGQLTGGDILITTRRDLHWAGHAVTPLTLDVLPRAASIDLLRTSTGHNSNGGGSGGDDGHLFDAVAADALAAELGDLPLALAQAGAYLAAHRTPIVGYLQRLRTQPAATMARIAPGEDPTRAVTRVFTLTLDTLNANCPHAVDILKGVAWLAPTPLPRSVTTTAAAGSGLAEDTPQQ